MTNDEIRDTNPNHICPVCEGTKLYGARTCGSTECLTEWREWFRDKRNSRIAFLKQRHIEAREAFYNVMRAKQ